MSTVGEPPTAAADSGAAGETRQPAVEAADPSIFQQYLRKILPLLLEDGNITPSKVLEACLDSPQSNDVYRRFLSDGSCPVILVRKCIQKEEDTTEDSSSSTDTEGHVSYLVTPEISFSQDAGSFSAGGGSMQQRQLQSVLLMKRAAVVEAEKSVASQVKPMLLEDPGATPYETLHNIVRNAVAPYFKSYIRATGKADTRDSEKLAPSIEKKIAELELGLLHLQQNIEIPEVTLVTHPTVLATIKKIRDSEDRVAKADDFGALVDDSTFLNALQNGVNRWIREIQKVTKLERDAGSGTAMQEISFWLNLEKAIQKIREKLETLEVTLTLDILKQGRRFMVTLSFDTDTGLATAVATVNDYNLLMKDFPLSDLLSATELTKLRAAVVSIFNHFKKIRNTKYPMQRCLKLVEAISRDLMNKLLDVLGSQRLMHMPFEDFERIIGTTTSDLFNTWDDEYEKLQNLLREQAKKKRDDTMKLAWRAQPCHKKLQTRLDQMRKFRRQHEQLRTVIARVLRPSGSKSQADKADKEKQEGAAAAGGGGAGQVVVTAMDAQDANAIEEVNLAYENVKDIDCLDVSTEGTAGWEAACKRYDERIDRVEARITARLRDQLGTAKSANEMFRIFSRFNALFVRPHIRGAIREYQTQLIQRVKDDIEQLHEKFKVNYNGTRAAVCTSYLTDVPPVSGSILWAQQIDRQLSAYLRRVEDVLGKGWEDHVEGQKLKAEGDSFRRKLSTQELFDDFSKMVQQQKTIQSQGRLFAVETYRVRGTSKLRMKINFETDTISLSKEIQNMRSSGFRIPMMLHNKAHQANHVYPFAVSLNESLLTYTRTCDKYEGKTGITLLIAATKREIHKIITEGCVLTWESYKLDSFAQKFGDAVFNFQEKIEDLLQVEEKISKEVGLLGTCEYDGAKFAEVLERIQKLVDELNLASFSNLPFWVQSIEEQVEKKLVVRLEAGLKAWVEKLIGHRLRAGRDEDDDLDIEEVNIAGGDPIINTIVLEIRITNQVMHLVPHIEETRAHLIHELNAWQAHVLELPRIQSHRYQVGVMGGAPEPGKAIYKHLQDKMPGGHSALVNAYSAIGDVVQDVQTYVQQWLKFQALWDLTLDYVCQKVGPSVERWMQLLVEITRDRTTFDTSESIKNFGPVTVDFGKVQSKVNLKYDSVHKEILAKFGSMLGGEMATVHTNLAQSRNELEAQKSIETASTSEAVGFITHVQSLKRKVKSWDKQVEVYKQGQKLLERQRFQFPQNWLYADHLDGEWSAFNEIMRRKDSSIQSQVASLQMKIVAEDKVIEQKTGDILAEWEREKPTGGNMKPGDATMQLTILEGKFTKLKEERDNMIRAKEALELSEPGGRNPVDEQLTVALEELTDLKGVWAELQGVWEQIDVLKDQAWMSVSPKKLRKSLEDLMMHLKNMPARLRQYESYEHVQRVLKSYSKMNMLIVELKADYLKERHWSSLMKKLRVSWVLTDLTLGHVWEVDLLKHEPSIREVLMVAQGENALEEFLKQVRNCWQNYELELMNYQNRTKIIRGWDDLFNKLKEHINSVQAMKLSPYYKVFEEEANGWEDKLNRVNALFDVWIDVQRRWVYLEGIFAGSADIKNLLPVETQRFQGISTEFVGLMKKVTKSPNVLDVLNIAGVQRQLERLADLLNKIQKALGEYLERERASFPRFYFVGDEDLLEIIGNSKNVQRLQKHFKKMFAGVNSLLFSEDCGEVLGVASGEAEQVVYKTPVSLGKYPRINEWLTQTENEMRVTLAKFLSESVTQIHVFMSGKTVDQPAFMTWLDSYQAQLVVIAAQIAWTSNVEDALAKVSDDDTSPLEGVTHNVENLLSVLADSVLQDQPVLRRMKLEHLIMEFVHQRDVTRVMVSKKLTTNQAFDWLMQMRFYFDPKRDVLRQLDIVMSNAHFNYGFEYLGVVEKLVQTPLTDRCFLTLTQALDGNYGGSPFGPAGTGKTESVKALGNQLGRFVLVFNCDETFDFLAMGRIFVGLCQVGAWGCFDEFNRLEEKMLSAVSQQIQAIQETLKAAGALKGKTDKPPTVDLVGKTVTVSSDMAIFITMNPGYAGRSNLPDNLKKLFRAMAMTQPDRQLISQVMLFSQGFRSAEVLSKKIVPLFKLCKEQLSNQSHYDFGLRALKAVLNSAGTIKLTKMAEAKAEIEARGETADEDTIAQLINEQEILIQSICETMLPKLIAEDLPLMFSLLADVFPGTQYLNASMKGLREHVADVCKENYYVYTTEEGEKGYQWSEKVMQTYQITTLHHGLMLVGPSGSGKTAAWRTLLTAMARWDGVEGVATVIDPKAIKKDELYGSMDPNTREWTDGIFTQTLRKVIDNVRGERNKRQWIVFDGDVDPEWVENLNSVLDCSKLYTLPNGERLAVPPNVRIIFEVQDLKHATLATVSRCGMIWFSEDVLTVDMVTSHYLQRLRHVPVEEDEAGEPGALMGSSGGGAGEHVG